MCGFFIGVDHQTLLIKLKLPRRKYVYLIGLVGFETNNICVRTYTYRLESKAKN